MSFHNSFNQRLFTDLAHDIPRKTVVRGRKFSKNQLENDKEKSPNNNKQLKEFQQLVNIYTPLGIQSNKRRSNIVNNSLKNNKRTVTEADDRGLKGQIDFRHRQEYHDRINQLVDSNHSMLRHIQETKFQPKKTFDSGTRSGLDQSNDKPNNDLPSLNQTPKQNSSVYEYRFRELSSLSPGNYKSQNASKEPKNRYRTIQNASLPKRNIWDQFFFIQEQIYIFLSCKYVFDYHIQLNTSEDMHTPGLKIHTSISTYQSPSQVVQKLLKNSHFSTKNTNSRQNPKRTLQNNFTDKQSQENSRTTSPMNKVGQKNNQNSQNTDNLNRENGSSQSKQRVISRKIPVRSEHHNRSETLDPQPEHRRQMTTHEDSSSQQLNQQSSIQQNSESINYQSYMTSIQADLEEQKHQIIHPKVLWDMSDEEWQQFGDRFPSHLIKRKLLGRGGFSLVWLGQDKQTKENFAVKQILTNNQHQTHIKEIWFGSYFFDKGKVKPQFMKYKGIYNFSKLLKHEILTQDTFIYYELCGDSLGNWLYDLKGHGNIGDERVYKIVYKQLYLQMKMDTSLLKKIIYELASSLHLLAENNIVHSDLKTENILIKILKNKNKQYQIQEVKLIDYGSAFTFGNLKNFSMATPEYMAPEILNFILYQNNLRHVPKLLQYLKNYNQPHVIDIWSLGCVILEIISGLPLWMSLKTLVVDKNQKESIQYGLFAAKGRVFELIIERQVDVVKNLDKHLDNNYSGIDVGDDLKYLVKGMLQIDPNKRITPKEICQYLDKQSNQ